MGTQNVVELVQPQEGPGELNAVLTIAGSDSSGGAGIEADIKTISAHKAYALSCITALTAQNTMGVDAVVETPEDHLRQILKANFADFVDGHEGLHPLKIVKTGMLTASAVAVLSEFLSFLRRKRVKLVVDPVMIATSGKSLVDNATMHLILREIVPSAYLCTPNFDEAVYLWDAVRDRSTNVHEYDSVDAFARFVVAVQKKLHCTNLLVKGGHVPFSNGKRFTDNSPENGDLVEICDVLYESETEVVTVYKSPRILTKNSHGTGCTLASAIAANLANGRPLAESVALSIHYVHKGMMTASGKLGHGNGPLNHAVEPSTTFVGILRGSSWSVKAEHGTFYEYFKTHPLVNDSWQRYTNHPFLELVATNRLPFEDFLYFLKQDLYYLIKYARVHGHAVSVAPDCEQIEAQTKIIANIMAEIERHKEKLMKEYHIDYGNADLDVELQPGPACSAYCSYLTEIGQKQDFLGIKVAVAPCLHGYAEAGLYGLGLRKRFGGELNCLDSREQSEIYSSWLDDYGSDWYRTAHEDGIRLLDTLFLGQKVSEHRKEELRKIFKDVVELEIAFWDEVVGRSQLRGER